MDAAASRLRLFRFVLIIFMYIRRPKAATTMLGGSMWAQKWVRCTDDELRRNFRVRWDVFRWILAAIEDDIRPKPRSRREAVQPDEQLAMFLQRMAQGCNYPSLAAQYNRALSTVHACCDRVRKSLLRRLGHHIARPTPAEAVTNAAMFNSETNGQLMGAVGAMDGTHIHVRLPDSTLAQSYFHHKYGISVILHAICDCRCVLLCLRSTCGQHSCSLPDNISYCLYVDMCVQHSPQWQDI